MIDNSLIILSALSNEMQSNIHEHFIIEHLKSFVASISDKKSDIGDKKSDIGNKKSDIGDKNKYLNSTKVIKKRKNGILSQFIRSHEISIPAADIIEAGRFFGYNISKVLIYNVRTKMRKQISNQS
jgi:hypothetical protein